MQPRSPVRYVYLGSLSKFIPQIFTFSLYLFLIDICSGKLIEVCLITAMGILQQQSERQYFMPRFYHSRHCETSTQLS